MLFECLTVLNATRANEGPKVFVDATFGAGGHARGLLEASPDNKVVALDADTEAVARARELAQTYPGRVTVQHANFAELDSALDRAGVGAVDGILYDLGLSSLQLAQAGRGFSFGGDEPLDMRLDRSSGPTASDLLQRLTQVQLETILRDYGDEHFARAIARALVRRRARIQKWRTGDLVAAVCSVRMPRTRIHPATRTFMALRIAVNGERTALERSLESAVRRLRSAGRLAVISFHSGEDRIVKRRFLAFAQAGLARVITRKPMRPSRDEIAANPRSRSAKLRAVARDGNSPGRDE